MFKAYFYKYINKNKCYEKQDSDVYAPLQQLPQCHLTCTALGL
jgi:hypothetical protein